MNPPESSHHARGGRTAGDVLLLIASMDDLVAVGGGRCDEGTLLTRFLLGFTVARLGGGIARRRRETGPTRNSCQKCNRAAATKEAAHLSKYRRTSERRHRLAGEGPTRQSRSRFASPRRCSAPSTCRWIFRTTDHPAAIAHIDTSATPRPPLTPFDHLAGHVGRWTVPDCRLSANRRGLEAPMATFS